MNVKERKKERKKSRQVNRSTDGNERDNRDELRKRRVSYKTTDCWGNTTVAKIKNMRNWEEEEWIDIRQEMISLKEKVKVSER